MSTPETPLCYVGVAVLLRRVDGALLMGQRLGVAGAGTYHVPGGKLEHGETPLACATRETREEAGLEVELRMLPFWTHDTGHPTWSDFVTLWATGEVDMDANPQNVEPEKCAGWGWYKRDEMPSPLLRSIVRLLDTGFDPWGDSRAELLKLEERRRHPMQVVRARRVAADTVLAAANAWERSCGAALYVEALREAVTTWRGVDEQDGSVDTVAQIIFELLAAQWHRETGHLSAMTKVVNHPAYQAIIAMGKSAIRPIIRALEEEPDHWGPALSAITGVCPVIRPEDFGRVNRIAAAWIEWASANGYRATAPAQER